ncbi:hypothetical protein OBA44_03845 [Bacteroidota bacterium]|nr:hypothetical protein [Bacteroidota bacterium]MDC3297016.1 hypothetical protein [Balneolaceae bacterium]CAI8370977.1 MAG: Uncharacterised protein [Rhodothermaeota bacterium MED-G12]
MEELLGLLLVGLWAAMGPYRQVQAQTINVSLADTAALAGEEILVPLLISPLSESDNVLSGTFVFNSIRASRSVGLITESPLA